MLLEEIVAQIASLEEASMAIARDHQDVLTKPRGSLGRLENLSIQLAGIFGQPVMAEKPHPVVIISKSTTSDQY
jgi:nicotinate-nucleotide--dimethylbenzimidazole phosphoribosyltransferase